MRGSKSSGGCGRRTRSISRACTITCRARRFRQNRCSPISRCGSAARPRRRSGAPRVSVRDGRRVETPEQAQKVVAAIKAACAEEGRTIDDDHYGAGIPFRFGAPDDPALAPLFEAYKKRTGRDPRDYFAIGDAQAIVGKIADYVAAGVSKFILRPAAKGDDEMMAQTRHLIDEVLPLAAARWPKPAKRPAVRSAAE